MKSKIVTQEGLLESVAQLRLEGQKVVHCHGVFDLFHLGHLRYLEAAKRNGGVLIVSLTSDQFVNKGPGRPVFSSGQRAEVLAALAVVDFVIVNEHPNAVDLIKSLKPDFYVKGSDYAADHLDLTENIQKEKRALAAVGGEFVIIDELTFSSSQLINNHASTLPIETSQWLAGFKAEYSSTEILSALRDFQNLKVLVLGEAIIDEYLQCEALGKSSKDPVLAFRVGSIERQLGGSLSVALHCAGLGSRVSLLTQVGSESSDLSLVKDVLEPHLDLRLVISQLRPTVKKRRYVDETSGQRVFETYEMKDGPSEESLEVARQLDELLTSPFDLLIVCDYGHGLIEDAVLARLGADTPLMALNVQANAGNRGFNSFSKYSRADFLCMNGSELALEARRKHVRAEHLMPEIQRALGARGVIVTEGANGMLISDSAGVTRVPAFAPYVRDRVGAGDALFSISSLGQALGVPKEVIGFLGNLAGAASVAQLGNSQHLKAADVARHAQVLMK